MQLKSKWSRSHVWQRPNEPRLLTPSLIVEEVVERAGRLAEHQVHVVHGVREQRAELGPVLGHALQHHERVVGRELGDYVHGVDAHVRYALCAFVDPADDVFPEEDIAEHGLGDGRLWRIEHGLSGNIRVVALVPGVHKAQELLLIVLRKRTPVHAMLPETLARDAVLYSPAHCPMWTVPRVLVRRTASPAHADFGGLSSLAALFVVRLDVVPLPPRSPRRQWRVVCWVDILLDVIC